MIYRLLDRDETNADVFAVRAMYRAFEAGDARDLSCCVSPDVYWVHPVVTRLPFDGTRRGLPALLRSAFRRAADGTGPRVLAETFVEFGDGVLVVGRFLGDPAQEDGSAEEPFMHECFVKGGKVIGVREYPV